MQIVNHGRTTLSEFILAFQWGHGGTKLWPMPDSTGARELLPKSHTLLLLTSRSHVVELVLNLANNFYKAFGKLCQFKT